MKKLLFLLISPFFILAQTPCLDDVANATGLIGEFIPQCEEDGSYSPIQCWSSTGYCWCVDENGIEIPGTSLGPGQGAPNCGEIEGCTNFIAVNYDSNATIDDGSCDYGCDALEITSIDLNNNQVIISVQNSSFAGFPYPGFILFNSLGDTIAIENINLFGIGDNSVHTLELTGSPFTSSVSLQLYTNFYDLMTCEWFDLNVCELQLVTNMTLNCCPNPTVLWVSDTYGFDTDFLNYSWYDSDGNIIANGIDQFSVNVYLSGTYTVIVTSFYENDGMYLEGCSASSAFIVDLMGFDCSNDCLGCTDPLACNYEPIATENNNSCEYCTCVDNVLISVNEKNYCLLTEAENNTIVYDYNWWQNNGFIFPDISGGTPSLDCNGDCPYNFAWTTIDGDLISTNGYLTNSDIMELGDYFLTVSDVNGCSSSMEFSILELNGDCINLTSFIETPTINRSLITTIDILGRETTNKGFQLHIYDDGSVEKSYKVE